MQKAESIIEVCQAETQQSEPNKKRLIFMVAKCMISGALICWILWGTNFSEIFMAMRVADKSLLLLAFSLHFIGYYVSAYRWRVLLKVQGIDTSIFFLIKSYMVCIFFNNFLPSIIGGDAVRAYDSWRLGKSKADAVAVISVDRFLGILALMLFALCAMLVSKETAENLPLLHLLVPLTAAGMLLLLWIMCMSPWRMSAHIAKLQLPFSRGIQGILDKIINAFLTFQGRQHALLIGLMLSLILQTNVIVHYYVIAKALHLPIHFGNFFLIIPLAIFVMMIPISVNAIGIREYLFVFFFAPFGVSEPEAIAFAWLAYGMVILQGLLGGMVFALGLGGVRDPQSSASMEQAVRLE